MGKLVQGVYMTGDQRHVLEQLLEAVEAERPDAVVIAGDLYDRAIPPLEAVELLGWWLERVVIGLNTPVLAISGNHDSPDRLHFASGIMEARGLYLAGHLQAEPKTVKLTDAFGDVHFHLVPYADPAQVRYLYQEEAIRSHDDAAQAIASRIAAGMDPAARHVLVGHAFVTPMGEAEPNTSDSERPLSIGGAEYVRAEHFSPFHYTALGHLHQAHFVGSERVRYAGSPLKYSISEASHQKGYYVVELDGEGRATAEKRLFAPLRDMRRIEGTIEEIERHPRSDDYVFVTLLNDNPVLFPMEKVRAVYPNALHVERRTHMPEALAPGGSTPTERRAADPVALFASFYQEVKGTALTEEKRRLFAELFGEALREEGAGL